MTPAERRTVVRALADSLVPLSENEVYEHLRSALPFASLPPDLPTFWDEQSEDRRRIEIRGILLRQSDDVLAVLADFLPVDRDISAIIQVAENSSPSSAIVAARTDPALDGPIFVVHGHARAALHETVRILERGTGRKVIILHEQANVGRTILEKFEEHAANASFAVVLLTGDDEGRIRAGSVTRPRGRQNVIFELGFFFGKLGRRRVAVLIENDVEKPSDIGGLVYINFDQSGAWKQVLARELEAVGITVNRSRML